MLKDDKLTKDPIVKLNDRTEHIIIHAMWKPTVFYVEILWTHDAAFPLFLLWKLYGIVSLNIPVFKALFLKRLVTINCEITPDAVYLEWAETSCANTTIFMLLSPFC